MSVEPHVDVLVSPLVENMRQRLERLFRVPGPPEQAWLAEALLRVAVEVEWVRPYFGGEPWLTELREVARVWRLGELKGAVFRRLEGEHDAAGIMVGSGAPKQPSGLQTLRALLWLVLERKDRKGRPTQSAVRRLSASLRRAEAPGSAAAKAWEGVLKELGEARSIEVAVVALSKLTDSGHKSLSDFWTTWFEPELRAVCPPANSPYAPDAGTPGSGGAQPTGGSAAARKDGSRFGRAGRPSIQAIRRTKPYHGQLPHEPADEFMDALYLVTVHGTADPAPGSVAEFYAHRAIWTGNTHLSTAHADALRPQIYGAAVRDFVARLDVLQPNDEAALGPLASLLKAVTGRTAEGLRAFRTGPLEPAEPVASGVIDLSARLVWIPVFWKSPPPAQGAERAVDTQPLQGYFRPTEAQLAYLVPTGDRVALPIPRAVHSALSRHARLLATLPGRDDEVLDRVMRDAVRATRNALDLPLTIGSLRRALGPLVMESCGDPALAQLICGESLGMTIAQQSYYAPKMAVVAKTYADVMQLHFGPSPGYRFAKPATRVGSELLLTLDAVRAMTRASVEVARRVADHPGVLVRQAHRGILDHLTRMLLATTGHRPAESLSELTLRDIDLVSGAALFADKRHDAAHDPRLAVLPAVLIQQLQLYLEHLARLGTCTPELSRRVELALSGAGPLLFDLGRNTLPVPFDLDRVRRDSPDVWNAVPWNWSRTWLRTMALESGAPAFEVAAQLGHFDSIGYPYSNQSPTDPLEVVQNTRRWLDRLVVRQGWEPVATTLPDDGVPPGPLWPPPLRDWAGDISQAEESARRAQRQWEQRLKSERQNAKEAALQDVLAHPLLVASGLSDAEVDAARAVPADVMQALDVETIRIDLVAGAGDDLLAATSRVRALRYLLRRLAKRAGVTSPPMPVPLAVRRPLDNAFFRGACLALTQVAALRDHVKARSEERRPVRTFALQVARTAEALVLFGGLDDPSVVRQVLEARTQAQPPARFPNALLVPIDGRVVALWDTAALALAALAHEFPEDPVPAIQEIDAHLKALLPGWAIPSDSSGTDFLNVLCSSVAVANRFELSPAARFALCPDKGAAHASLVLQLAFIDGDAPRPEVRTEEPPVERNRADTAFVTGRPSSAPLRQYRELLALFPKQGRALVLPRTSQTIAATELNTQTTRDAVIAEIDLWLRSEAGHVLWPVVDLLGRWIRHEAQAPKPKGGRRSDRTLRTYVTRIGGALVRFIGELEITRWDEEMLEDAYAFALARSDMAKEKVAAMLLRFHRFAEEHFDMPDADLAGVYAHLALQDRRVDAEMILPAQRSAARARVRALAEHADTPEATRNARQADADFTVLAEGGLRLSESLGLCAGNVTDLGSGAAIVGVRPNRMRGLKSLAGRRSVELGAGTDGATRRLIDWKASVVRHAPPGRGSGAFLFAQLDQPRGFDEHGAIVKTIRSALADATGRRSERLHRLRHLKTQELVTRVGLSVRDARALEVEPHAPERALQPRDLGAISVMMGHARPTTTLQWYVHVPLVLQSRAAARLADAHFDRRTVAGALGYSPAFFDGLRRGGGKGDEAKLWFDHFRAPRALPQLEASGGTPSRAKHWVWTAQRVGDVVARSTTCRDVTSALRLTGAPLTDERRIVHEAARWERKLGRRLLPEVAGENARSAPPVALRRLASDADLEKLWRLFDEGCAADRERLQRLANAVFAELLPGDGETLVLDEETALDLATLLKREGVEEAQITQDLRPDALVDIRVQRRRQTAAKHPVLYGLRRVIAVIGVAGALQRPERFYNSSP